MNVVFVGLGHVGGIALELFKSYAVSKGVKVRGIDIDPSKEILLSGLRDSDFIKVMNSYDITKYCRGFDVAAIALPSRIAFQVVKEVLSQGVSVVDVSFINEDPYSLERLVNELDLTYVPDAGFAPGFSNLVIGYAQSVLGTLEDAVVRVGGVPQEDIPPLNYVITWSAEDLIEEYVRPARVIRDFNVMKLDPLAKKLKVRIEGIGEFEGFYSDGLRTMLRNIKARNLSEVTLRRRGHLKFMEFLRDLGFFSNEFLDINGVKVVPKLVTAKLLEKRLSAKVPDMAILEVYAKSSKGTYKLIATLNGTPERPATSLFTAVVFEKTIELLLDGKVPKGVVPLEKMYYHLSTYIEKLESVGATITQELNLTK